MKCVPLFSRILSLFAESNDLQFAVPGGLIGVGTMIDPTLTRADRLVGQVLGSVGNLPEVRRHPPLRCVALRCVASSCARRVPVSSPTPLQIAPALEPAWLFAPAPVRGLRFCRAARADLHGAGGELLLAAALAWRQDRRGRKGG